VNRLRWLGALLVLAASILNYRLGQAGLKYSAKLPGDKAA